MTRFPASQGRLKALFPDGLGLLGVLVLAVCVWHLVHGLAVGTYDQFHPLGDMSVAAGPVGDARANQLGHVGYFWSERAFHYRTTLMFAVDDFHDPSLLAADTFQQSPGGVNAWRQYTLLMEPVYGTLYRWFGRDREILVDFLLRLIPLIHVLLLPGLYFTARALGARPVIALAGTLVYAGCSLGYFRLVGSLLLKEDFALLFFMGFLAAHFGAWRRESLGLLGVACGLLGVFLASWHLSQFLLLPVAVASAVAAMAEPDDKRRLAWRIPAAYLLTMLAVGLTPSLRARGFLLSPAVMVLLALLVSLVVVRRLAGPRATPGRRLGLLLGLSVVLLGGTTLYALSNGNYNHVFGLAVQKIRHGFRLPEDPGQLPFDVRVFWVPPFTSPAWGQIKARLGWQLLVLLPTLIWTVRTALRPAVRAPLRAFLLGVPVYLVAWLFIERLGVVFLPMAAVATALALEAAAGDRGPWPGRGTPGQRAGLMIALVAAVVLLNLATVMRPDVRLARAVLGGRPVAVTLSDMDVGYFRADLLRWLKTNTPGHFSRYGAASKPASVVADIGLSTQISLYARRPTVLNSQFENAFIRQRYADWLQALFATDPSRLADFLHETQADYLVIGRDWLTTAGSGTAAYQAGVVGNCTLDMTLARLQFDPTGLDYLQPVYNNEFYRVFKVLPAGASPHPSVTWERNHGLWWQAASFTVSGNELSRVLEDRRDLLTHENALMGLQKDRAALMGVFEPRSGPTLAELHQQFLQTRLDLAAAATGTADPGRMDGLRARERALNQAIRTRLKQSGPDGTYGQALQRLLQRGGDGEPGWLDLLTDHAVEPMHLAAAGQVAALLGRYGQAADLLDRADAFFPLLPVVDGRGRPGAPVPFLARQVRTECIWWNMGAGRLARARELAARYLPTLPSDDPARTLYEALLALENP